MQFFGGDRPLAASAFKRLPSLPTVDVEVWHGNVAVMKLQGLSPSEVRQTVNHAPSLMKFNMTSPLWAAKLLVFESLQRHFLQRSFQSADVLRAYPNRLGAGALKVACRLAYLRQCSLLPEVGAAAIPLVTVMNCCWIEE